MKNRVNVVASLGLALGGIFGMIGTMAPQASARNASWAIDSMGIVVAASLLSLKYFRKGCDFVAAGFLVLAIGESVMLSGTASELTASVPSFAAGTAAWAAAMLLISVPAEFPLLVRIFGIVTAVLFAIVSARIFLGEAITPLASPLPFFAYPFLVLTFAGWFWKTMKTSVEKQG